MTKHRPALRRSRGSQGATEDGNLARRTASRERIVRAAVELMAERGFTGTSVDDIAARAKVAKGTVFYNFGSKEQVFLEVMRLGSRRLVERLRTATAGLHGPEALNALVLAELGAVSDAPAFARLFLAELYRGGTIWGQSLQELRDDVVNVVRSMIVESQLRGSADPDLDPDTAASLLVGVVLVAALDWLAFTPQRSLEEVHAALMSMLAGRFSAAVAAPETAGGT